MSNIRCLSSRCSIRGRHLPEHAGSERHEKSCGGCLPRPAADGARLCQPCTDRVEDGLIELPALDAAMEAVLGQSGDPGGEKVSRTPGGSILVNARAVEARRAVRQFLAAWVLVVAAQRGHQFPGAWRVRSRPVGFIGPMPLEHIRTVEIPKLADWLGRHVPWLAAQRFAGEVADQLAQVLSAARSAAYPNPSAIVHLGPCPEPDCIGQLTAVVRPRDSLLPSAITCDWWAQFARAGEWPEDQPAHQWSSADWHRLGRMIRATEKRKEAA